MNSLENLPLENSFARLGEEFYQSKSPDPVTDPYLVHFNARCAELIGLGPAESVPEDFVEYFSGNRLLPGSKPLAMAYTGYQFGVYNPHLGDGRGLLLGEVKGPSGALWDLHLKGCGPTRFARGFDGRATLRSCIREYLGGEAMHGLGIPTTRSLAIVGLRELIYRELPELAAVLVRIAESHIRFGSFELFYYTNRPQQITRLADYAISRHFPEFENEADKYRLFFREVILRTARLIASWQSVGFAHGVLNTDNMSITGLCFDYGPFGFMDTFNPRFIPNRTDTHGRYGFDRQPEIGFWNLQKLGQALSHLLDSPAIEAELASYQPVFNRMYREKWRRNSVSASSTRNSAILPAVCSSSCRPSAWITRISSGSCPVSPAPRRTIYSIP